MTTVLSVELLEDTIKVLNEQLKMSRNEIEKRDNRMRELHDIIGKLTNSLHRIKQDAYVDVHRDIRIRGIDDDRHLEQYINDRLGLINDKSRKDT